MAILTQAEWSRRRAEIQDRFNSAHVAATTKCSTIVEPAERQCALDLAAARREYDTALAELKLLKPPDEFWAGVTP